MKLFNKRISCACLRRYSLLLGFFCFCSLYAQINWQNPSIRLGTAQGLPDNYIKSIAEDKYGFTWIASNKGLSRYDGTGVEFIESEKLPGAYFSKILVDQKRDQIWIGTYVGLFRMDLQTFQIEKIKSKKEEDSHEEHFINALYLDRNERLWVGSRLGLAILDLETEEFEQIAFSSDSVLLNPSANNYILDIIQDPLKDEVMWVASVGGLFKFELAERKEKQIIPTLQKLSSSTSLSHLFQDPHSYHIYASVKKKIGQENPYQYLKFDPISENFVKGISIQDNWQSHEIFSHSPAKLYLSTNQGLAIYNCQKEEIEELVLNTKKEEVFRILFKDSLNRIWTTSLNGLEVFDPLKNQCQHFYYETELPKAYHVMTDIYQSPIDGKIYLSVYGGDGLYEFDPQLKRWKCYYVRGMKGQSTDFTSVKAMLDGTIVVSAYSQVYYLDKKSKELVPLDLPFSIKGEGRAAKILRNGLASSLWISFRKGLYHIDWKKRTYKSYPGFPKFCQKSTTAIDLFMDDAERLWCTGYCTGFSVLDSKTEEIIDFSDFPAFAETLKKEQITSINQWKDTVYVLSVNLLLAKIPIHDFDKREGTVQNIAQLISAEKFPELANIKDIHYIGATAADFDKEGNYIILTNHGILRFNLTTQKLERFGEKEGFIFKDPELEVLVAEKMQALQDGRFVYGTRKGIHIFDPRELSQDKREALPYILNIDINDSPFPVDSNFYFKNSYQLEAGNYYLSFDFSALNPAGDTKLSYKHKLEGIDENWRSLGNRNSISYPNMKGGTYTFKLMVNNAGEGWSSKVARAQIKIEKFWYNTYIARSFGLCILICLAILIYQYKINRAIEKEQMKTNFERKLAEVKMNALTAQMNPHFIFNSLNSIDYFIIKNESVLASEYLNRFSRLIRLILNNSRSNYISLKDDLDALKLYIEIESLRFDNKFEYVVKLSNNLDPELVQVPPMLFQPYVENAIWHGLMQKEGTGKIEVNLRLDEREEVIIGSITDNGIGRKKALELKSKGVNKKKNKSMGMQITHDKIEAINFLHDLNASVNIHDLYDEAGNPSGTKVVLEIPI